MALQEEVRLPPLCCLAATCALAASSFQFCTAAALGGSGGSPNPGACPLCPVTCIALLVAVDTPAEATALARPAVCLMGFGGT